MPTSRSPPGPSRNAANASGVSVKFGSQGVSLQMESLRALLLGGVAFDTPSDSKLPVATAQARTSTHSLVVDAPAPIAACLDPLRIEQVLVNLVNNAIKYSPDGGTIGIAAMQRRDTAQVAVRDHGLGIPATELSHVFDRYYRASNVGQIGGTGIGLAGVRQIVQQHGGTISVESAGVGGDGSTFHVRLPHGR